MAKTYHPYSLAQMFLLPPSLHDWLPEYHLAYFVVRVQPSHGYVHVDPPHKEAGLFE
jgi:hypothetical protein